MRKQYIITDPGTGQVVCRGDAEACTRALGLKSVKIFHNTVNRMNRGLYRRYRIETERSPETLEAIRRWDAFTEPLRRRYGIARYREV